MESELELIKTKLKSDDYDIVELEKKINKIEKKLMKLDNQYNNLTKLTENHDDCDTLSDTDTDDDMDDNICNNINIIKKLDELDKKLNNLTENNDNITIEELLKHYEEYMNTLNKVKTDNENFKLKIDYI